MVTRRRKKKIKGKVSLEHILRLRKIIRQYKAAHGCCVQGCDERDPCALDFHHLKNKKDTINRMISKGVNQKTIAAEMKKCIIICSNCHRKLHAHRPITFKESS